jgi:hypothetical protein
MERQIDYPTELTFKSVFINSGPIIEKIRMIMELNCPGAQVRGMESRNARFVSCTVTAVFDSDEHLRMICGEISGLDGFMTMF